MGIHFSGSSNFILAGNLKVLKLFLNGKNKEVFVLGF